MHIGDFARLAGVSLKALRLYDQRGVFRPAFRDPRTGYREYHPAQLSELSTLLALMELGVPLAELRSLHGSTSRRRQMLERVRRELERRIERSSRSLAWVEAELAPGAGSAHGVVLRGRSGFRVASLRRTLGEARDVVELERELLARVPSRLRGGRRGALWHSCDGDPGPLEAECFVELRPGATSQGVATRELPPVLAACSFTMDDDGPAHQAFDDVRRWVRLHGHALAETKRELYWDGALEVQFPVALSVPAELRSRLGRRLDR